jgi:CubicO group peptidase (beta-lactamase class C family)
MYRFLCIKSFCILILVSIVWDLQSQSFVADSLDRYITEGMKDWQVPGLSIVIIKDGKVVKMRSYGVKDITSSEPVDEHTLFFIASNSKLFTGTAIANLHQAGKLSIQDPITKYYPDFKLYDPVTTPIVTIKDMLTHRIGTKTFQGDFTFWDTKLTSEEIMYRMRFLKPSTQFRDAYGYCNSCYMTAGMIIPKVTSKSWAGYITDEIIKPLGMNETSALSNDIASRVVNIAKPYTTSFTNKLKEVPYDIWDNLGPAASIVSNVNDLAKWLNFQLDSGRVDGKTIMPWKAIQMTRDVAITTSSRKSSSTPSHFRGYGLGVNTTDYNASRSIGILAAPQEW